MKGTGGIPLSLRFVYFYRTISDFYRPRTQTNGLCSTTWRPQAKILTCINPTFQFYLFSPPSFPLLFGTGRFASVNLFSLLLDTLNYSGHFTSRNVSTFFGICFPLLTFYSDTEPFGLEAYADGLLLGRKNKLNGLFTPPSFGQMPGSPANGLERPTAPLL